MGNNSEKRFNKLFIKKEGYSWNLYYTNDNKEVHRYQWSWGKYQDAKKVFNRENRWFKDNDYCMFDKATVIKYSVPSDGSIHSFEVNSGDSCYALKEVLK